MEVNELRIGNYVMDRGKKVFQIDHWETKDKVSSKMPEILNGFYGHPTTEFVDYLLPIPLTEEWLLRVGFEIYKEGWFAYAEKNKVKFDISYISEEIVLQGYNGKRVAIEFVHQLQNLYFALTGEELTLKAEQ